MKQAIILAAGKGSRLSKYTKNVPKALLPIKYGQMIIERMLHQLQNNGIQEIVVVVGYKKENSLKIIGEFTKTFKNINIRIAINNEYDTTGTLKSLLIGMDELKKINEDILVVEGDVVCDESIIEKIVKDGANTVLGDSSRILDDEAMKYDLDQSGYIHNMSKNLSNDKAVGEAIGVVRFGANELSSFLDLSLKIFENNKYAFYEEVINSEQVKFNVIDVSPHKWTEVDFPSEYKKARQIISDTEKIKIDYSLFEKTTHSPSIFELIGDLDIEIKDFCFLANPYLLNDLFIEEISLELKQLFSTYPPLQYQLRKSVSKFHDGKILPENIIVGNGATELIDIINFTSSGSIVPIPTFSEYIDSVKNLLTYQLSEKNDYNLDINHFIEFCKKQDPKKYTNVILINPNNPIGRFYKKEEIIQVLIALKEYKIIVDESFLDFSDPDQSVLDELLNFDNLIIVKSFGKTLGMPGARLGAIYSNKLYIDAISKNVPIWNVNCIASHIIELMSKNDFKNRLKSSINKVKRDTMELYCQLDSIPYLKAYKPTGNFVMIKLMNGMLAKDLRDILLKEKIFVRDCSNKIGLDQKFVRIASRTKQENLDISKHIEIILADYESD